MARVVKILVGIDGRWSSITATVGKKETLILSGALNSQPRGAEMVY